MFRHTMDSEFPRSTSRHWLLLSFLAGSVNAGGYLAYERFVTHMTGFATLAGIAVARGEWFEALVALTVPSAILMALILH